MEGAGVTINGGVFNICSQDTAIGTTRQGVLTINGGTMELAGPGDQIVLGSVTITGGSVTAWEFTPAPTNGSAPVYAVTVEGMESGAVDAFLLKRGEAMASPPARPRTAS